MDFLSTDKARCECQHNGVVELQPSQDWVTVDGEPLLVKGDLDRRPIALCVGGAELVGVTRCHTVATVEDVPSHSRLVEIDGRGVVFSTACGTTDWSNVAAAPWTTKDPGQSWVAIDEVGQ